MRVLLIKLSSLGDVFHTFPAITDAQKFVPDLQIDWLVEESFAGLTVQHPAVNRAIPVRIRKIRKEKNSFRKLRAHWRELKKDIASTNYDLVIDAQGLIKSAILTRLTTAPSAGFGFTSAREPLAAAFYKIRIHSDKDQHAIERSRQLLGGALGYSVTKPFTGYGLNRDLCRQKAIANLQRLELPLNYVVFLHGASWHTKTWPKERWRTLATALNKEGVNIFLPWGDKQEKARAEYIADGLEHVRVLPGLSIVELVHILSQAEAVTCLDSGLGHVPIAFDVPGIILLGPTAASRIGLKGPNQITIQSSFHKAPCYRRKCNEAEKNLCCMAAIEVDEVKMGLQKLLISSETRPRT